MQTALLELDSVFGTNIVGYAIAPQPAYFVQHAFDRIMLDVLTMTRKPSIAQIIRADFALI